MTDCTFNITLELNSKSLNFSLSWLVRCHIIFFSLVYRSWGATVKYFLLFIDTYRILHFFLLLKISDRTFNPKQHWAFRNTQTKVTVVELFYTWHKHFLSDLDWKMLTDCTFNVTAVVRVCSLEKNQRREQLSCLDAYSVVILSVTWSRSTLLSGCFIN